MQLTACKVKSYDPGVCLEKSNRLAIERPFPSPPSGEVSFRFNVEFRALTPGPAESTSTLPSTSSSGRGASWVEHFGSLEGNVG